MSRYPLSTVVEDEVATVRLVEVLVPTVPGIVAHLRSSNQLSQVVEFEVHSVPYMSIYYKSNFFWAWIQLLIFRCKGAVFEAEKIMTKKNLFHKR